MKQITISSETIVKTSILVLTTKSLPETMKECHIMGCSDCVLQDYRCNQVCQYCLMLENKLVL